MLFDTAVSSNAYGSNRYNTERVVMWPARDRRVVESRSGSVGRPLNRVRLTLNPAEPSQRDISHDRLLFVSHEHAYSVTAVCSKRGNTAAVVSFISSHWPSVGVLRVFLLRIFRTRFVRVRCDRVRRFGVGVLRPKNDFDPYFTLPNTMSFDRRTISFSGLLKNARFVSFRSYRKLIKTYK